MKLLPKTTQAIRRCATITQSLCSTCPGDETRCCSALWCAITEAGLLAAGLPVPAHPGRLGVPFLGESGCVVPAENRPFCSTFVCPERLEESPELARQVEKHRARVFADPVASRMCFAGEEHPAIARELGVLREKARKAGLL